MNLDLQPKRIRISIGGVKVEAELNSTRTAQQVYAALPIETAVNMWGEEFYCKLPGVIDYRETATTLREWDENRISTSYEPIDPVLLPISYVQSAPV